MLLSIFLEVLETPLEERQSPGKGITRTWGTFWEDSGCGIFAAPGLTRGGIDGAYRRLIAASVKDMHGGPAVVP